MTAGAQTDVVSFLKTPSTHGTSDPVEVIETHAAFVFLTGPHAYKIKRAVRYDYLDYSTLALRRDALHRELELNAPSAPGIYRDVVPITRDENGNLVMGGTGDPVEWVLRMHRFRTDDELVNVADRGELDLTLAEALGASIARYHAQAARRPATTGSVLIRLILEELDREFAKLTSILPAIEAGRFSALSVARLADVAPLLDARSEAGHVKRCHGDLHLRNIVLLDGDPVPFDALEFDEQLGTCDVLYDLAFLLMDLHHRNLDEAANGVLNAYLRAAQTDEHMDGLAALPLFLGVRAAISAMVSAQTARARGGVPDLEEDGRRYLAEACTALTPPSPVLVAVGGLSGSGKTTLARSLAPWLGPMPGAVHLRSDIERKAMLGVDAETRLPDSAYGPEVSARVYARIAEMADRALRAGHSVIADAVYLAPEERHAIAGVARDNNLPFSGLWLEARDELLVSRVETRRQDASDADARVVRSQLKRDAGDLAWDRIDASGSQHDTLKHAQASLELHRMPEKGVAAHGNDSNTVDQ